MIGELTIKDIYAGKPDAKDEIGFDGIEGFVKSFVIPDTFILTDFTWKQVFYYRI